VHHVLGEEAAFVWHQDESLEGFDAVIVPGGFAYGDYLRSGAIARFSPIIGAVVKFAEAGGLVMGICNGFQILVEAGLLPGALIQHRHTRFLSQLVYVKAAHDDSPFTAGLDTNRAYKMPIAHHGGNYIVSAEEEAELRANGQIAFYYSDANGELTDAANPNGSVSNIAGVMNATKNVMGLMPHPERAAEEIVGTADGRAFLTAMVDNYKWHPNSQ
jgi:phosphoribosylformylglycinamidine synthase